LGGGIRKGDQFFFACEIENWKGFFQGRSNWGERLKEVAQMGKITQGDNC